jgi:hypothetical protein
MYTCTNCSEKPFPGGDQDLLSQGSPIRVRNSTVITASAPFTSSENPVRSKDPGA